MVIILETLCFGRLKIFWVGNGKWQFNISTGANQCTDELAKRGHDIRQRTCFFSTIPCFVFSPFRADIVGFHFLKLSLFGCF